jgi:hypothetical protein
MTIISRSHGFIFIHQPMSGGALVKTAYQPYSRWCDLVLGHTRQGQKLEPVYRDLFGLTAFSPISQIAAVLGADINGFTTIALSIHPLQRVAAMHQTAQRDVQAFAEANRLPEAEAMVKLRAGQAPKALLRRLPIQAYLAATSIDDFVVRLIQLSRSSDGYSQLSSAFFFLGPGDLAVQHVYRWEQREALFQHLDRLIGHKIQRPSTLQPPPAVLNQFSEATRRLLKEELAVDYNAFGFGPEVEMDEPRHDADRFSF